MGCFYNQKGCADKMTREHVVSDSVLKELLGLNKESITHLYGKKLIDVEHKTKDVCAICNNKYLSPYDVAGKELAVKLMNKTISSSKPEITLDLNTVGWLVKTHLNHTRVIKDIKTGEQYIIKQSLKDNLIKYRHFNNKQINLYLQLWEEQNHFWDKESESRINIMHYSNLRLVDQKIVISNFRIRQLDTLLIFPYNMDYNNFVKRAESAIKEFKIDFPCSNFQRIDLNTIKRNNKILTQVSHL
jgi:hypothetical protein